MQISSCAIQKILYHNSKYISNDCYGILVGQYQGNNVVIENVYPLFHTRIMTPTLEVAMNLIETKLSKGQQIIGIYQGLVNDQDNNISEMSSRISFQINSSLQKDTIVIKVLNSSQTMKLQAFQYNKNNIKLLQEIQYDQELILSGIQKGIHRQVIDFDNHFENPQLDFQNNQIQ